VVNSLSGNHAYLQRPYNRARWFSMLKLSLSFACSDGLCYSIRMTATPYNTLETTYLLSYENSNGRFLSTLLFSPRWCIARYCYSKSSDRLPVRPSVRDVELDVPWAYMLS